jgi:phosphoglycerate-specific signal transduction histidine kinase
MPYIEKSRRERFDWLIDNLAAELEANGITGNLNYILYRLAKKLCKRYKNYAAFEGDCQQSLREIYRRLESSYEDEAIERNGDIE